MFGIGVPELIVILALALIVLGPEQLPKAAKQLAKFVGDLKRTTEEFKEQLAIDEIQELKKPLNIDSILEEELARDTKSPDNNMKAEVKRIDLDREGSRSGEMGGLSPSWKQPSGNRTEQENSSQDKTILKKMDENRTAATGEAWDHSTSKDGVTTPDSGSIQHSHEKEELSDESRHPVKTDSEFQDHNSPPNDPEKEKGLAQDENQAAEIRLEFRQRSGRQRSHRTAADTTDQDGRTEQIDA